MTTFLVVADPLFHGIYKSYFVILFHCTSKRELYDVTLNEVNHLLYATDISYNDSFTFRNAMKQDDKIAFVDAMEKEISNHEKGGHWSIVHRDTLPNKERPIKVIWSFKRKRKPDCEILNHNACLCAHVVMQQWGGS